MAVRRTRREVGERGEDLAAAELERQGLVVLARNWQCGVGEIDIIAEERLSGTCTVIFCEVKCRTGLGFGDPLEAITYAKLRKLRQLAAEWLAVTEARPDAVRLDAVGVVMIPGQRPRLTHVRGIG
jgi:putative endonuclease